MLSLRSFKLFAQILSVSILDKIFKNNHVTKLKEGDPAPDFSSKDQNGKTVSLKDFTGKKVVLYFYPKDDTPGCTAESCNLRDNYPAFLNKGYVILGVSADNEASHEKFSEKYKLPFSLLADTDKKIIRAYDVWGEKLILGVTATGIIRTTFVISENRIIEKVITQVDTQNHTSQIIPD